MSPQLASATHQNIVPTGMFATPHSRNNLIILDSVTHYAIGRNPSTVGTPSAPPGKGLAAERLDIDALVAELYAFLEERPVPDENAIESLDDPWRVDAQRQLDEALAAVDTDAVVEEAYAFLGALTEDERVDFRSRAFRHLADAAATHDSWENLLSQGERVAAVSFPHHPIEIEADTSRTAIDADEEIQSVLTLNDLQVTFRRGAIGGPPALTHSME